MKSYLSSLLLSVGLFLLLVSCNSGTVRKISSFDELPDPTADTLSDWSGVPQGLHASFVSTDVVFRRSVAPDVAPSASAQLEGWRGERVSAQLLLWTASGADGVEVKVGPFRSDGHTLSEDVAQARFVRYVLSDEFGNKCGYHDPTIYPPHLVPDMLDDIDVFDIKARNVRPVWITISVPADTPAGEYVSTVKLFANSSKRSTSNSRSLAGSSRLLPSGTIILTSGSTLRLSLALRGSTCGAMPILRPLSRICNSWPMQDKRSLRRL